MHSRFGLRYGQLLVVFVAFVLMAAALLSQQARGVGVRGEASVRLLDAGQIAQGGHVAPSGCLVLYSGSEQASLSALQNAEAVFEQLSVEVDATDVDHAGQLAFEPYEKVVLALSDLARLGDAVSELTAWVQAGGQLMVFIPPEANGFFQAFAQQLGVREVAPTWYESPGIRFTGDLMLGGRGRDYMITEPYESSLCVSLMEGCTVHAVSADDREVPLIWEYANGAGRVVFCNIGITEKANRGIYAQAFGLLGDAFAWPVINGSAFYLDDFPAPVPEGSGEYIEMDYATSARNFYTDVWWPDLVRLARRYGVVYTGMIIEDYNATVEPPFAVHQDLARFEYFASELLRLGGELGIHGYNHIPLVIEGGLEGIDGYITGTYEEAYQGYPYWPSYSTMLEALQEFTAFTEQAFPGNKIDVYVPPSNILSQGGRTVLLQSPLGIRIIASIYFESAEHVEYVQDFGVAPDGIVNTPRVISGGVLDEYMLLSALSELNLHFVSSHFMHPDDMLDEDRGAALGWMTLYGNICDYAEWLYGNAPQIRNLTGTAMGAAVQRWYDAAVVVHDAGDALVVDLEGLHDEVYLFLRSREPLVQGDVEGGRVERLDGSLYLVCAAADALTIPKEARGA